MLAGQRKLNRRREFPAAAILIALAVLPLFGVLALSLRSINEATTRRSGLSQIEDAAQDVVLLGELRVAIYVERNWALGINGMADIGIPLAEATSFLGFDLLGEQSISLSVTDELLERIRVRGSLEAEALAEIEQVIRSLRGTNMPVAQRFARIDELQQLLDSQVDASYQRLNALASSLPSGQDVASALQALEAAFNVQILLLEQQSIFVVSTLYSDGVTVEQYALLIQHRGDYETNMDRIRASAIDGAMAQATLDGLADDADTQVFAQTMDQIIASVLLSGVSEPVAVAPTLISILASDAVSIFRAILNSADKHSDLMLSTALDLTMSADELREDSIRDVWEATAIGVLFAVAAFVAVLGAIRSFVRPLNLLAFSAQRLIEGDIDVRPEANVGPSEVRSAARAMRDAGSHLRLLEHQALALSEGNVNDPLLEAVAPGRLGSSLHQAVRTLARSMKEEEVSRQGLAYEATHDGLTDLANRSASVEQITTSLALATMGGSEIAVLFLDLDGFKQINDRLGHRAGDLVLQTVADRLRNAVRPGDHVGRLGGDEFVIIAESVELLDSVEEMASRLIREVGRPLTIDQQPIRVGVSIGLTVSSAYVEPTASKLLGDADLAVYRAKDAGTGQVVVCNDRLRLKAERDQELLHALRQGLTNHEFTLHYQASVSPSDQQVKSLEALIRWKRPGHGLLTADSFIDFASESAIIIEIDQVALDMALLQLQLWTEDPVAGEIAISVNVSKRSLAHPDFVAATMERIDQAGVNPRRLIVEVKEDCLFADVDTHGARLQELRDHGVQVAIDNFGTGYSSLAQLRQLPVDILKIDRSFVARVVESPEDAALVSVLVDTARVLGATVLAEGVETQAQAEQMLRLGSGQLQGYLFSQPKPALELLHALRLHAQ